MSKRLEKTNSIIQAVLSVLATEGTQKLSMRKVAEQLNMTLSNLQYYYKDKDQLLVAAVAYFFKLCQEDVEQAWTELKDHKDLSLEEFVRGMLALLLIGPESQDRFLLFKEIRSLALRNEELQRAMDQYYTDYCDWFVTLWSAFSSQPESIVALLVPYTEGYGIVGNTLPLKREQLIDLLAPIILKLK